MRAAGSSVGQAARSWRASATGARAASRIPACGIITCMKRALVALSVSLPWRRGADGTFTVRILTPETALKASQAALKSCRDSGFQVAVAVVDGRGAGARGDRYAGPHTPDMATAKAYTAVSFRTNTTELAEASQPGRPASGIRHRPGVAAVGGGMMIEAGGRSSGRSASPGRRAPPRTTHAPRRASPRFAKTSSCETILRMKARWIRLGAIGQRDFDAAYAALAAAQPRARRCSCGARRRRAIPCAYRAPQVRPRAAAPVAPVGPRRRGRDLPAVWRAGVPERRALPARAPHSAKPRRRRRMRGHRFELLDALPGSCVATPSLELEHAFRLRLEAQHGWQFDHSWPTSWKIGVRARFPR